MEIKKRIKTRIIEYVFALSLVAGIGMFWSPSAMADCSTSAITTCPDSVTTTNSTNNVTTCPATVTVTTSTNAITTCPTSTAATNPTSTAVTICPVSTVTANSSNSTFTCPINTTACSATASAVCPTSSTICAAKTNTCSKVTVACTNNTATIKSNKHSSNSKITSKIKLKKNKSQSTTNSTSSKTNNDTSSSNSSDSTTSSTTPTSSTSSTSSTTSTSSTSSTSSTTSTSTPSPAASNSKNIPAQAIIDTLRANYDGSLAQTIVGRAIWYMEYGNIVYGHTKYATTGYCDCSQFVSMVYKDFGYSFTSAAKNYDQVGVQVSGVYVKNGTLVGADKLKPGDILTFERTDYISHVAMYVGMVNGKPCFIGTTTGYPTAIGIMNSFDNWYGTQFHDVRRVLPDSAYTSGGQINDHGPVIPAKYQMTPVQTLVMPNDLPAGF